MELLKKFKRMNPQKLTKKTIYPKRNINKDQDQVLAAADLKAGAADPDLEAMKAVEALEEKAVDSLSEAVAAPEIEIEILRENSKSFLPHFFSNLI